MEGRTPAVSRVPADGRRGWLPRCPHPTRDRTAPPEVPRGRATHHSGKECHFTMLKKRVVIAVAAAAVGLVMVVGDNANAAPDPGSAVATRGDVKHLPDALKDRL